ncbi:MAG: hypothetical protein EP343_10200 [Deltaproteobacteria bacterium]|nr:MAG: hypothetical protein EP343_10200 [Deltaproteobacteria bacterium]
MVTPNQSSQDSLPKPGQQTVDEEEEIILLGSPKDEEDEPVELLLTAKPAAPATTPDLPAVPDDEEEEEILLLTNPSGAYRVPEEFPPPPQVGGPDTLLSRDQGTLDEADPEQRSNPVYRRIDDSSTEEVQSGDSYTYGSGEDWNVPIPQAPSTNTPVQRAPDTQPPLTNSYVGSMDAITAALDLESLPSPMSMLSPVFGAHGRDEESSEAELMLNDWLSPASRENLDSSSSPGLVRLSESSVSLSEISSLLEDDDFVAPIPAQLDHSRSSHEQLRSTRNVQGKDHPRYQQLQQIRQVLAEFTQLCARACCFLHKDGMLVGFAALGKGKIHERIEELLFPVDVPSQVSTAVLQQQQYQGPLGISAMDHIVAACLGGATPRTIALIPIVQQGTTTAVYYLDDGGEDNFLLSPSTLKPILDKALMLNYRWSLPQIEEILEPWLQD